MKTDANWCMRMVTLGLILIIAVAALSCGGNGTGVNLAANGNGTSAVGAGADKAMDVIPAIPESEINSLPAWQRELLSDPGWNQPYIAPREGTPVVAPALSSLKEETLRAMAEGTTLNPRFTQGAGKGASWYGDSAGPFPAAIAKGEYEDLLPNANPPFGCNSNAGNTSAAGNAIEDLIQATAVANVMPNYSLSYVREGLCSSNYFNTLAGASKNASAAVYQAYCSVNGGGFDVKDPPLEALVAEISYRSSLVPAGNPSTTCGATAYLVEDYIWRAFNKELETIPGGPVNVYDVLIAPSGPRNAGGDSPSKTTGVYQPFYFGNMSGCYGGAWIIGLTASDSKCDTFAEWFDPESENYVVDQSFWYHPVYGVILQRWLDMSPVANQPWTGELGWPVYGPTAYANGTLQLNAKGAYYQWGMWFERGFIWWVDYDQVTSPTVPDEAQVYRFTGDNVYCYGEDDALIEVAPKMFYGAAGPLGVAVTVDAYRNETTDDWSPVEQNELGTEYHVSLPADDGLATVQLKMHAQGYGGTPNAACKYKTYVWAFRDGTIQSANGGSYNDAQKTGIHTYGDLAVNKESTYVVRVQVQDEVGFAYGDSLPIVLGHGGSNVTGEIMVIRDDAPGFDVYNTNFDALLSDLDLIGAGYSVVEYTPTVQTDFVDGGYKVAIWYRGGPGAAGEPDYTTNWTTQEEASFNALLQKKLFLVSQEHGAVGTTWNFSYWGWDSDPDSQFCQRINGQVMTHPTSQNMGLMSNEDNGVFGWLYVMFGGEMGKGKSNTRGPQRLGLPGVYGTNAAERNLLTGSSGKLPSTLTWGTGGTDVLQFCGRGWYPPFGSNYINSGWTNGMLANPDGTGGWSDGNYGAACLSYGNATSGGASWQTPGPGKFWCWGMPYAKLTVTGSAPAGMVRAEVLQNVLSWLDNTLTFEGAAAGAAGAFAPYDSAAEIVSVMPGYWTTATAGFTRGAIVRPGIAYPDTSGTDVYKTNYTNLPGQRYVTTTTPGNNGSNVADIDFQFPWYAYITNTDGVVETSPDTTAVPPALTTNDTVVFKGLLVNDNNQNWARYTPPAGQLPNCLLNKQTATVPTPAVAGYFTSTTGNSGDEIYASYGTGAAAMEWDNQYKLEVEAVAHWPLAMMYGTNPATLKWSMFPGHRMYVPGTGTFLTDSANGWESFRTIFDIDPTAAPAGRATSSWNAANFDYSSVIAEGRVVSFNYRSVNGWNPDINRDGDANPNGDTLDKFPVRCRLFTDYANYIDSDPATSGIQPYIWPNNEPPASTYVEGGCYVVDKGLSVYRVRIATNGLPIVSGQTGAYTITVPFVLRFGTQPYTVTVDADYDGTWNSAPAGRVFAVTGFDNTTTGAKTGTVNITTMPDGNYNFAIRVVDFNGDVSTAAYSAGTVPLFPTSIFQETFEGGARTATSSDLTWTLSGPQGDRGHDWENQTGAAPFYGFTAHGGSRYVRWNTTDQYNGQSARRWAQTGPYTIAANTFYRIELFTNGSTSWVYDYYYMSGLRAQLSYDGLTWWDIPTTTMHYDSEGQWQVTKAWSYASLGQGVWQRKTATFTSGAANTLIYFRYGFESDPYNYADGAGYPNNGGPAIDDIKLWPPPPPPAPVWSESFESGMGNWTFNSNSGSITMAQATGSGGSDCPSGAQNGSAYCATYPRPYTYGGGYCYYTLTSPVTVAANTTYDLAFFTGGRAEGSCDGLRVGWSIDGTNYTWLGPDSVYGHGGGPYVCYSYNSLGGTTWTEQLGTVATGAGQTQLWIRIGFEADSSVNYNGPTLDSFTLRAQ